MTTEAEMVTVPRLFDMEYHLRGSILPLEEYRRNSPEDANMFSLVSAVEANWYSRVIAILNTDPPVRTPKDLKIYQQNIAGVTPIVNGRPEILYAIVLTPETTPDNIRAMVDAGVFAFKKIPPFRYKYGSGINDRGFEGNLRTISQLKIPLICHEEFCLVPEPGESERLAMNQFISMVRRFPEISYVLTHISTERGLDTVRELNQEGFKVFGALTLHHALCYFRSTSIDEGNVNYLRCSPPLSTERDELSIRFAMLDGEPYFGFGSDSAAHRAVLFQSTNPPLGIFTSSEVATCLLATIFEQAEKHWVNRLVNFALRNTENFFGLLPVHEDSDMMTLLSEKWFAPTSYPNVNLGCSGVLEQVRVVPFWANGPLHWKIV